VQAWVYVFYLFFLLLILFAVPASLLLPMFAF
jgi:hypothetical protein